MANCRSCGRPIRWCRTAKGKLMPVDPTPNPDGKFTLVNQGDGNPPLVVNDPGAQLRYVSHFATCPQAHQHRKKG